jgi:ABC-type branched-subunit amino acid transport system substrate-binding protein
MLSVGPVRSSIWQRDYKYIFMVFSPFEEFFIASINFAIEHKLKTVGLLVNDTPANKIDVRNGLIMAKEKGLKIVLHEDVSPGDYNTIERFIREIRHIEPDIIISAIYPEEAQYYANILRELRWRRTVWIDYFAASNKYYTEMLRDTENIFGVSQWEPEIETPENKNFVHEYRKKF